MKQIRIKREIYSELIDKAFDSATELNFGFAEQFKHATMFTNAPNDDSEQKIDKQVFLDIWNKMMSLNFTKIFQENETIYGLDGYTMIIQLECISTAISIRLWSPDKDEYLERGWVESARLMECVEEILKVGEENGISLIL